MATPAEWAVTISARDEATETLRKVRREMGELGGMSGALERSIGLSAGSLNTLGGALEKLGGTIPGLSTSFRGLGSVMTSSVGGAATGLATSLLAYGVALNRVADDQARFQRALHSLNAETIRGELGRVNDELDRMADIGNRIGNESKTWLGGLQSFISRLQSLPQVARETFLGAETPEAQRARLLAVIGGPLGAQEAARQTQLQAGIAGTQQRALLFQQQRRLNAEDLTGFLALQQQLEAADKRERDLALRALGQRQGLELVPLQKAGIPTGAVEQTQALERQALAGELEIGLARQKLAREEQAKALRERQIDQRFAPLVSQQEFRQEEAEQQFALTAELQRQADARVKEEKDAADARLRSAETYADFVREEAEQQAALEQELARQRTEGQAEQVEFAARRAQIMEQQVGLSRAEYAQAQLVTIEAQRQLEYSQARNDAQRELANLTAQVQSENIQRRELERTDPAAGIAAGQRQLDEEAMAGGDRLRSAYLNAYHDISQGFTDIVVDGLTNQGERIGEIGKQMGKRLLAGFVDQISQQLFSRAFGALSSAFGVTGPGRPLATAVPALTSPFATAGAVATGTAAIAGAAAPAQAGGVLGSAYLSGSTGGAAASPALVTGPFAGRALTAAAGADSSGIGLIGQGIGLAKEFLGGFFGATLSVSGVLAAYNAGGLAGVATAQSLVGAGISETTSVAIVGQEAIGLGAVEGGAAAATTSAGAGGTAAGLGATAASAAAAVFAAAALAYTAYSAYQSGDVVGGIIGGAVSGLAFGAAVGGVYGAVIGLVVGAAIGGVSGQLGKEEQEIKTDRRRNEADRQRRGTWIYQDLMEAIQTGVDHEDVAEQTVRTGHSVGGLIMGVAVLNQTGAVTGPPWGWPPSEAAQKTAEILAGFGVQPLLDFEWDRINSTAELIATWHNPRGVTEGDIEISENAEALMAAFVAKVGATVLIGYEEEGDTGLRGSAGRLNRTTLLLSSRAREAAGRDIFVVENTLDNLTEEQRQRILQRLVEQDADQNLERRRTESDYETTVAVTHTTTGRQIPSAAEFPTSDMAKFLLGSITADDAQVLLQQLAKVDRDRDLHILNFDASTVTVGEATG